MDTGTKIDLFELADANKKQLESEYQRIKLKSDRKKSDLLESFGARVKNEWHLSINMHDWPLFEVLDSGKYVNVYELKDNQAEQLMKVGKLDDSSAKSAKEEAVRKHLKTFYEGRKIFDSSISKGEKARYAALNIGGVGTTGYGRYCIVIKREKAEKYKRLAFIKEDSAVSYVDNGCLLLDKLMRDVTNKECVDILAVVKHENEIETISSENWNRMVCNDSSNIEAVTLDDILRSHIKCVRIDKTYYKEIYWDSLAKIFNSELTEIERYRLTLVKKVFKELEKRGIELEIIDEN
ncbi:MAG: hypothetical protein NT166_01235 [Candidatus Aminicenantes bacterium]|nr:hypothetical protein [Candidatus Aminicenantes bacterium]